MSTPAKENAGPKTKPDFSAWVALIVAVVTATIFIVRLEFRVSDLEHNPQLQKQITDGVEAVKTAQKQATSSAIGVAGPQNKVICTGSGGCDFSATPEGIQHEMTAEIPDGRKILGAWYEPVENTIDMASFQHVDISVHGRDKVGINLQGKPGANGRVRIYIYALYGPM